ncbi:MAG: molecular chaperone DnaJ [Alphaproteobacteria bacterium]|nr:molecular chaperone DnaJ [Alphaproteobacteria bacterium]
MSNVVGINEFVGTANGETHCWLCQKPLSIRALFCHFCGTVQPVREIDHFTRLGLDRSLDVDGELLERQYKALNKSLDPERFLIRGIGERGHASKQRDALNEAYETLRKPLKRGRYWLRLQGKELDGDQEPSSLMADLRQELLAACDPCQCDRAAQKAGQLLEQGVVLLMKALREENWAEANAILVRLDGIDGFCDEVRVRRKELCGIQH